MVKEGDFIQCIKHLLKNDDLVNEKDNVLILKLLKLIV